MHEVPPVVGRPPRGGWFVLGALALLAAAWVAVSCADPNDDAWTGDPDAFGEEPADELGPGEAPEIPYWHTRDPDDPGFQCSRCHPNQHDNRFRAPEGCLYCHGFE